MAEPLKNQFGADVPHAIGAMLQAVHRPFPVAAFVEDCLSGYDTLELMPRGRHIASALRKHLPQHVPAALDILVASLGQPVGRETTAGMGGFLFMPHCFFVAEHGLDNFEESMRAQHALTQRFTAEFSIRPFLVRHPKATLARLRKWANDPSDHVRRLVSEGTRPRLPWAPRLAAFQADPAPVLELLELLRDDPALYVRRSVANNLNDIGKDHPQLLAATARRWLQDAPPERVWVVRHALRWAVKQGAPWALDLMGFGHVPTVTLGGRTIAATRPGPHSAPAEEPVAGRADNTPAPSWRAHGGRTGERPCFTDWQVRPASRLTRSVGLQGTGFESAHGAVASPEGQILKASSDSGANNSRGSSSRFESPCSKW